MFDSDTFMSATVEGENSTVFIPVPEGEFQALAEKVESRNANGYVILDVTWSIDDDSVVTATGRDKNTARQSIFLDMTDAGGIDMGQGKNIQLGKLREAIGQNGPGAWSPSMILGNVAKIRVAHRLYEGTTYADVKGTSAI